MSRSGDPGSPRWIEEIRRGLDLSPKGVLILVDHATPTQLGPLVRALLADHPDLDVHTDVAKLAEARDGAVIVFLPRAADADWLNLNRPMFARKALKVVLFCEHDVSVALAQRAPDFYDWIAQRQECPAGAALHAVCGIRAALRARAPGILFVVDGYPRDPRGHVQEAFQGALPERRMRWLEPSRTPYARLVQQIREAGPAWVACNAAISPSVAERFRWALAEVGRRTRAILLSPEIAEDRFWPVSDALFGTLKRGGGSIADAFGTAIELLASAGAKQPGRLAAVAGQEVHAIAALIELLARDYREDALLAAMLRSPDPGAGLGETILSAGLDKGPRALRMWPPVQRHLGNWVGLRRQFPGRARREVDGWEPFTEGGGGPLLTERAAQIERLLLERERSPERWLELAELALELSHADIAATWAERALAMRDSAEAQQAHRRSRAELGRAFLGQEDTAALARLSSDKPGDALALADAVAAGRPYWRGALALGVPLRMLLLATALNRGGRAHDAEVILRKLLGLPVDEDMSAVALGLASRENVLSFLHAPMSLGMDRSTRQKLQSELVQALRAQGRHQEADEVERLRDQEDAPTEA